MSNDDQALTLSNPRLLSAAYFSLLAIIITIIIDTVLTCMGVEKVVPLYKAVLLAVGVAGVCGALVGKAIIQSPAPYKKRVFLLGFLMVIVAVPLYNVGFIYMLPATNAYVFIDNTISHAIYIFFITLLYSYLLAGVWMALLAGLAAVYLRGYLANYIVNAIYVERQSPQSNVIKNRGAQSNLDDITHSTDETKK